MAIFRANTKQDDYCYHCRQDVDTAKLRQCVKCKNWFCQDHISSVPDPNSMSDVQIDLCDKDQGRPSI